MTMRVPLFYEEYHMFKYTLHSMNNDDDEMRYLWIIRLYISKEGIHILVEFKLVQSQGFSDVQQTHLSAHENLSNVHQHVTIITQVVSDKSSMLYPDIQEDDEDDDNDNADYNVSSAYNHDKGDNDKEDDVSIPLNPLSSTEVN